jgi:hypothetical protein
VDEIVLPVAVSHHLASTDEHAAAKDGSSARRVGDHRVRTVGAEDHRDEAEVIDAILP